MVGIRTEQAFIMPDDYLTIEQIQEMVKDPKVTKQDMANQMFKFRDKHWWIGPFIKNKKRIVATLGTLIGLSSFTGHKAGDSIVQYLVEKQQPQIQVIDPDTFEPVEDQYYED